MLKQRALDVVLAIDRIRDLSPGPEAMLSGIVHVMVDHFQADLCLLYLRDRETQDLTLRIVNERDGAWRRLAGAVPLQRVREVMQGDSIHVWEAQEALDLSDTPDLPSPVQLAGLPVLMESEPLGVMMLARGGSPFDADELELLRIAESQIDSAIIQSYTYHELAQRNKELETIYRFDRIRDQHLPFDEMLDVVLQELCDVIEAEMGFVMLYNRVGERLEMRALTHDALIHIPEYYERINAVANAAVQRGELICCEEGSHCTLMCIPLILRDEIIGVFGAVNRADAGPRRRFTVEHKRLLRAIVSQMDTAILENLERRRLRSVLGRSLDPRVLERLLANPDEGILDGERMTVSVLYADLRGSTALSELVPPDLLVGFINDFLGEMTDVILAHEGTLDKFIGDEVMALFGAPLPQPDHPLRAVRVGLAMQAAQREVVARWQPRGVAAAGIGVGIATGELTVGEIGCARRTDYTVIGPAANLGARICTVAKLGQVLISEATYRAVADQVEAIPIPNMHFKGIDHPVTIYDVRRLRRPTPLESAP